MSTQKRFCSNIPAAQITPEAVYRSRRQFMQGASALATAVLLTACGAPQTSTPPPNDISGTSQSPSPVPTFTPAPDDLTGEQEILNYNNFFEFTVEKEGVAAKAQGLIASPWEVAVGGLVRNPGAYDVDDLKRQFDQEERVYRLRCVETWSMVIPWLGFPLHKLLQLVEPLPEAQYVRFETLYDPEQMPGQKSDWYEWPYVEGLRLDEALHDLTLLATGLYGKDLQPQNGAPIRLVVPWKYGFKSIKSIVKIDLVAEQPTSLWMKASSREYGFYANVNPDAPHPRWSQATERRLGEARRRKTLLFNGYEAEVAYLYAGMDLKQNF
ncbi:MAG: protein-methionine-sulfoxide reductase catalytic subunit MsrP [Anaerolinea sp.]|nr:protein-methionine-sulfoxide reductase catalytic subunit MsrP [Anaerolinea sp.]